MEIHKTLDLLERVEREISDLYESLQQEHRMNKEVAAFFQELYLEEQSHIQIIRMERRIVQGAPKAFSDVQINLSEINSLLENILSLKTAKLSLPELIGRVYAIESNPAEKYLIDALKDTNDDLRDFLLQLGDTFSAHADKVAIFARKLGVQLEDIQNRYLRKARVSFENNVLINQSLNVRGVDISEGGLFVLTGKTFPLKDKLAVQFTVGQTAISAETTVQFVIEDVGMGLMFTSISDSDTAVIKQYVAAQIEAKGVEKHQRVLLVGSSQLPGRDMRSYMHALLGAGYKVVDLSGFEDAANFLRKGPTLSCIIIAVDSDTDANYYLLSSLSLIERYQHTPLMVLTNSASAEFKAALRRKGVAKLLTRISTTPRTMADEIRSLLAKPPESA